MPQKQCPIVASRWLSCSLVAPLLNQRRFDSSLLQLPQLLTEILTSSRKVCSKGLKIKQELNEMTTSQRYLMEPKLKGGFSDMEWQTPAVSEKFQSRFGRRPGTADSGDTGFGATPSDSTEDFPSSCSSPSFQPIRSQIPIPTAHVMPSTAGAPASQPQSRAQDESQASAEAQRPSSGSRTSSGSSSKSSLSKSVSSPNLDAPGGLDPLGAKPDCLSRYRSLVNGLDHSLFPLGDHSRLDHRFETPAVEPTLNQSALLGGLNPDVRLRLQMTSMGETTACAPEAYRGAADHSFRPLPEARPAAPGGPDACSQRGSLHTGVYPAGANPPGAYPAGAYPAGANPPGAYPAGAYPPGAYPQAYLGSMGQQAGATSYEPLLQDRNSEMPIWQQQNQLDMLRLQMEHMQLLNAGVSQYQPLYSASLFPEAGKWDSLVKANESQLKEKEMIIERQKQQMSQLEQRLRDSEMQVHGALLGRGAPYGDVCLLRLQEAQRENAFLRAQFAERSDCAVQEKAEAERRLGAVETETRRLTEALKEAGDKHAEELGKQEERIRTRDKHINSLKKKCQKEVQQNREKQQRIETLERYLADLPTMEDYQSQSKQLLEAEQQASQLQGRVQDLEKSLEEARSRVREKETQLEEQIHREKELLTTVTSLQERVQEGLEDGARLPSLDVEKLREENRVLREEHHRLKKVIEKQLRMMEQLGAQIRTQEERIAHEESSSQALSEELRAKDRTLLQMHTAMKELSEQNQQLLEQKLTLQEHLEDPEWRAPERAGLQPAGARLTQKLHREMASCLGDLRSVCNVLTQRAQGRNPNLSLLLGITSPPVEERVEDWLSAEVLQEKLAEAQKLRRDVEELRTTISDRYAQDMGDNCITQ